MVIILNQFKNKSQIHNNMLQQKYKLIMNTSVLSSNPRKVPREIKGAVVSFNDSRPSCSYMLVPPWHRSLTNIESLVQNTLSHMWSSSANSNLVQLYGFTRNFRCFESQKALSPTRHFVFHFLSQNLYKWWQPFNSR